MSHTENYSIEANSRWLKEIFQSKYSVPKFQRHYSWTLKQVEQLWLDLISLHQTPHATHFLGSVVFVADGNEHSVVDGQQRLTTLSLLLCAMVGKLFSIAEHQRAFVIKNATLSTTDIDDLQDSPKLTLNTGDDVIYRQLVKETPLLPDKEAIKHFKDKCYVLSFGPKLAENSNQKLLEAYSFFQQKFEECLPTEKELSAFYKTVVERVLLVRILAHSDTAAFSLFETLNDRGLDLSVSDLIKNHLFLRAGKKTDEVQALWQRVEEAISPPQLPDFLRHNHISVSGDIQKERLFRVLKESCESEAAAVALVQDFASHAELYKALIDAEIPSDLPVGNPATLERYLGGLKAFGVSASYPILISTYRKHRAHMAEIAKYLVSHAFRYYVLAGLQSGRMGKIYAELAKEVYEVKDDPLTLIRERLGTPTNSISDATFVETFIEKDDWKSQEAKFVLHTIENMLRSDVVASGDLTLEHILPQGLFKGNSDRSKDWDDVHEWTKEEHANLVSNIGNLTLLKGGSNSALGKKKFREKVETEKGYLESSELIITKSVLDASSWSPSAIRSRSEWLATNAVKAFSL